MKAEVIAYRCVAVEGTGPRGGRLEYVVHFNRDDSVRYVFCDRGPVTGYLPPHQAPADVLEAARKAMQ